MNWAPCTQLAYLANTVHVLFFSEIHSERKGGRRTSTVPIILRAHAPGTSAGAEVEVEGLSRHHLSVRATHGVGCNARCTLKRETV